jgi:hypothetical protein
MLTENTRPPSLTSDEYKAFEQFAALKISLDELRQRVARVCQFDFLSQERRLEFHSVLPEPAIRIEKRHISNALEERRRGGMNSEEVSHWASMLLMNDVYDWEGPEEDQIAEWLWILAYDILETEKS